VTVNDTEVSSRRDGVAEGLACRWSITKTLKPEPNTASLTVYNLSPSTRARLTKPGKATIRIEAGYGKTLSQIYLGDVRAIMPGEVQGSEISTEFTSGDGEKEIARSHLAIPIGAKTDNGKALQAIAKALGVGMGNVSAVASKLATSGRAVFPRGTVLVGNVARQLTDFCRSANLEWSIQDGALQILDVGASIDKYPYVLRADSGLIGSPKVGNDGKVSAQVMMLPGLRPGLRVMFDTLEVSGLYRIVQTDCDGETHADAWGFKLSCEKSKAVV
jgi:hypothetical protein